MLWACFGPALGLLLNREGAKARRREVFGSVKLVGLRKDGQRTCGACLRESVIFDGGLSGGFGGEAILAGQVVSKFGEFGEVFGEFF